VVAAAVLGVSAIWTSAFGTVAMAAASCGGDLSITAGGSYQGCWTKVSIDTSQPVTITNSTIGGAGVTGDLLNGNATSLTVTNTRFVGTPRSGGYAVWLDSFSTFRFEHNSIEQKGGVKLNNYSGGGSPAAVIRYNQAHNIDGRLPGGGTDLIQFVQFDAVNNAPGVDISWNRIDNDPGNSSVEDNINMHSSSGTAASPILIHDNLVHGAYGLPATDSNYSGGGILLGDYAGAYETARDNVVVSSANYGIAVAAGQHMTLTNNQVISAGQLPGGAPMAANVGAVVWNQYSAPFGDINMYGNTVGYSKADGSRNDWWLPDCDGQCSNTALKPGQPITTADEQTAITGWESRAAAGGIHLGPTIGK
jgi:hypothetical protein